MPIQFACPKCKAKMTVKDSMAGKSGKCKCGNSIMVPAAASAAAQPRKAAAPASNPSVSNALDELMESDFNRESPMNKVYGPKVVSGDGKALQKFEGVDVKGRKAKSRKLNGGMIFIAVINLIQGISALSMMGIVLGNPATLDKLKESIPELQLTSGQAATYFGVFGALLLLAGVGLLLKQSWGWVLAAMTMTVSICQRLLAFVFMVLSGQFNQANFFGAMIGLFIVIGLSMLVFKEDNRQIFRVKSTVTVVIAVILGIVLYGAIIGLMANAGMFSGKR